MRIIKNKGLFEIEGKVNNKNFYIVCKSINDGFKYIESKVV